MPITVAIKDSISSLVSLLNSAYRGEESKKGWTTEADLLLGESRTDATTLKTLMDSPGAVFLEYKEDNELLGCVFLQKKDQQLYLGMLSVSPTAQAKGIGKELMSAADDYARKHNCNSIFMKVISVRHELIAWYERKGFIKTGETEPFPDDNKFGVPTQKLEFLILEKTL